MSPAIGAIGRTKFSTASVKSLICIQATFSGPETISVISSHCPLALASSISLFHAFSTSVMAKTEDVKAGPNSSPKPSFNSSESRERESMAFPAFVMDAS